MKYKISESKLKNIVFKYFDKWSWINGLKKKSATFGLRVYTKWTPDDDEFFENDVPFQVYEKHYFTNPDKLDSKDYPQLVLGREVEDGIKNTFGFNDLTKNFIIEWFNKTYNENVKRI